MEGLSNSSDALISIAEIGETCLTWNFPVGGPWQLTLMEGDTKRRVKERTVPSCRSNVTLCLDGLTPNTSYKASILESRLGGPPVLKCISFNTLPSLEFHRLCHLGETFIEINWVRPSVTHSPKLEETHMDPKESNDLFAEVHCTPHLPLESAYSGGGSIYSKLIDGVKVPSVEVTSQSREPSVRKVRCSDECSIRFTDLLPNVPYLLKIRSFSPVFGYGAFGKDCAVQTLPEETIFVSETTSSSATVERSRERTENQLPPPVQNAMSMHQFRTNSDDIVGYTLYLRATWEINALSHEACRAELDQITHALELQTLQSFADRITENDDPRSDSSTIQFQPTLSLIPSQEMDFDSDTKAAAFKRQAEVAGILAFQKLRKRICQEELSRDTIHEVEIPLETNWDKFCVDNLRDDTTYIVEIRTHYVDSRHHKMIQPFTISTKGRSASSLEAPNSTKRQMDTTFLHKLLSTNTSRFLSIDETTDRRVSFSWSPVDLRRAAEASAELMGIRARDSLSLEERKRMSEIDKDVAEWKVLVDRACDMTQRCISIEYCVLVRPRKCTDCAELLTSGPKTLFGEPPMKSLSKNKSFASRFKKATARTKLGGVLSIFLRGSSFVELSDEADIHPVPGSVEQRLRTHTSSGIIEGLAPNTVYDLQVKSWHGVEGKWNDASNVVTFITSDVPVAKVAKFPVTPSLDQAVVIEISPSLLRQTELQLSRKGNQTRSLGLPWHNFNHGMQTTVEIELTQLDTADPTPKLITVRRVPVLEIHKPIIFKNLVPGFVYSLRARKRTCNTISENNISSSQACTPWGASHYLSVCCHPISVTSMVSHEVGVVASLAPLNELGRDIFALNSTVVLGSMKDITQIPITVEDPSCVFKVDVEDRVVIQVASLINFETNRDRALQFVEGNHWKIGQASVAISQNCSLIPFGITDHSIQFYPKFGRLESASAGYDLDSVISSSDLGQEMRKIARHIEHSDSTSLSKASIEVEVALEVDAKGSQDRSSFEVFRKSKFSCSKNFMCVSGLPPNTHASIRARPIVWFGDGPETLGQWSEFLFFSTLPALELAINRVGENSISCSWSRNLPPPLKDYMQQRQLFQERRGVNDTYEASLLLADRDPYQSSFGNNELDAFLFIYRSLMYTSYEVLCTPPTEPLARRRAVISVQSHTFTHLNSGMEYWLKVRQLDDGASSTDLSSISDSSSETGPSKVPWSQVAIAVMTHVPIKVECALLAEQTCLVTIFQPMPQGLGLPPTDEDNCPLRGYQDPSSLKTDLFQLRVRENYVPADSEDTDLLPPGEDRETPIPLLTGGVDGLAYWLKLLKTQEQPWYALQRQGQIFRTPVHISGYADIERILPDEHGIQLAHFPPSGSISTKIELRGLTPGTSYGIQVRRQLVDRFGKNPEMAPWSERDILLTRSPPRGKAAEITPAGFTLSWTRPPESAYSPPGTPLLSGYDLEVIGFFQMPAVLPTIPMMTRSGQGATSIADPGGNIFLLQSKKFRVSGSESCFEVCECLPGSLYVCSIRAHYGPTHGPSSQPILVETVAPLSIQLCRVGERHALVQVERRKQPDARDRGAMKLLQGLRNRSTTVSSQHLTQNHLETVIRRLSEKSPLCTIFSGTYVDSGLEFQASIGPRGIRSSLLSHRVGSTSYYVVSNLLPTKSYCVQVATEEEGSADASSTRFWSRSVTVKTLSPLQISVISTSSRSLQLSVAQTEEDGKRNAEERPVDLVVLGCEKTPISLTLKGCQREEIALLETSPASAYVLLSRGRVDLKEFGGESALHESWFSLFTAYSAPVPPLFASLYESSECHLGFFWDDAPSMELERLRQAFERREEVELSESDVNCFLKHSVSKIHFIPQTVASSEVNAAIPSIKIPSNYPSTDFDVRGVTFGIEWRRGGGLTSQWLGETDDSFCRVNLPPSLQSKASRSEISFRIQTRLQISPGSKPVVSEWGPFITFIHPESVGPSKNLMISDITTNSAVLQWAPPNNSGTHNQLRYTVEVMRTSLEGGEWSSVASVVANQYELKGLHIRERYKVKVTASSSFGIGPSSHAQVFMTSAHFLEGQETLRGKTRSFSDGSLPPRVLKFPYPCPLEGDQALAPLTHFHAASGVPIPERPLIIREELPAFEERVRKPAAPQTSTRKRGFRHL